MQILIDFIKDLTTYGLEKIGWYYSVYRGYVADNQDPKNLNRLKLTIPELYGDDILDTWAWPLSNYSGMGYGIQVIPRINDLIQVTFEKGNPRKPLWSFGHFGIINEKHEKADLPESMKDIKSFWFRTPGGHTIELNDTDATIKIISANGQVIHFGKDFISLGKETQSSHTAVLGDILQDKLNNLIDILKAAKVNTMLGPQPFFPVTIQQLTQLKDSLGEIQSEINTLE